MAGRDFEPKVVWNSVADDIVGGFYRPALRGCVRYDRLAGFFDSNTFAVALREVMDFVERGGRMRLITSAKFSQADLDVIKKSVDDRLLEDVSAMMDDDIGKKCLGLFAHMLANKIDGKPQLDMRILVPQRGIFHAKVGVFEMMNGDIVSFSGSVNETGMGWTGNIEEFKAFCSWTHKEIVDSDVGSFDSFWNGAHAGIRSFSLPHAVREKILSARPGSDAEYRKLVRELRVNLDAERDERPRVLRDYQTKAVDAWASRRYRGILEMPTATGKTFTAMGCINRMQHETGRLFTVIVVPYTHLAQQWIDNVSEWNGKAGPDERISTNTLITSGRGWQAALGRAVNDFNRTKFDGRHIVDDYIVCTTYDTLSASQFIERIRGVKGDMLLVADEAHHAGARTAWNGLLEEYSGRLALTATPERYFDEDGSDHISKYFNDVVFSMEIKTAIDDGHLVPYDYHPRFVELTADETKEYARLTRAIAAKRAAKKDGEKPDDWQNAPENRRATLVAKMENKYAELAAILDESGGALEHALIYCRDTEQMSGVGKVLSGLNINFEVVTGGDSMTERWNRIRSLEMKNHQCIVSMKCLDEGVDIPSASLGIILASTGNNREYIQRRGRLLRHSDGKDHATIYDLLATAIPEVDCKPYAKKLVAKELLRHKEFADAARNRDEALGKIRPVAERLGIDLDRLDLEYVLSL